MLAYESVLSGLLASYCMDEAHNSPRYRHSSARLCAALDCDAVEPKAGSAAAMSTREQARRGGKLQHGAGEMEAVADPQHLANGVKSRR